MPVYFNVGRANRSGVVEYTSPDPISPPPGELLEIVLTMASNQMTDPSRRCTLELSKSLDAANWQFIARMKFRGDPSVVDDPMLGVDSDSVIGYYIRGRMIIGDPSDPTAAASMNVGVKVQSRPFS